MKVPVEELDFNLKCASCGESPIWQKVPGEEEEKPPTLTVVCFDKDRAFSCNWRGFLKSIYLSSTFQLE